MEFCARLSVEIYPIILSIVGHSIFYCFICVPIPTIATHYLHKIPKRFTVSDMLINIVSQRDAEFRVKCNYITCRYNTTHDNVIVCIPIERQAFRWIVVCL